MRRTTKLAGLALADRPLALRLSNKIAAEVVDQDQGQASEKPHRKPIGKRRKLSAEAENVKPQQQPKPQKRNAKGRPPLAQQLNSNRHSKPSIRQRSWLMSACGGKSPLVLAPPG